MTVIQRILIKSIKKNVKRSFSLLERKEGILLPDDLKASICSSLEEEIGEEMMTAVPKDVKIKAFRSLEEELGSLDREKCPGRIAEEFNSIFKTEFERRRKSQEGGYHNIPVLFDGEYRVNLRDPSYSKLFYSIGYGCPLIPIDPTQSIIARALVTGEDQHVPDTSKDPAHWVCSEEKVNEEVYVIFSQPLSKGPLTGYRIAVGVLDFDFINTYTLTKSEHKELGEIVRPYGELIFPGEPKFEYKAQGEIYVLSPQEAKNREIVGVA